MTNFAYAKVYYVCEDVVQICAKMNRNSAAERPWEVILQYHLKKQLVLNTENNLI